MASSLIALIQPAVGNNADARRGALAALRDSAFALVLYEAEAASPHMLEELRHFLTTHRPHGAILMPPLSAQTGLVDLCLELSVQPVRLSPSGLNGAAPTLCSNDRQAAADATNYLIALGHMRIGFIAGPEHCPSAQQRELGFIDALAAHELDRGAELVAPSDGSLASGEAAARLLLEISPRPTAIFAASDEIAAGALRAAQALKVAVPDALSIIGFGDTAFAALLPVSLTSVRLPISEMAFSAAIQLIGDASAPPQPAEFFGTLIARATTGPAPN